MNKQTALEKLTIEINHCRHCKEDKIGKIVFGEGDPDAKIMFVGEAPGKQEAKEGRPFIGRSGKYLRSLIKNILHFEEKDVYITSPVKYLPKRGTPSQKDIDHARVHFNKQVNIIDPKVIVLLGSTAIKAMLDEKLSVMKERGKLIEKDNRVYFISIHPAAAVRFAKYRATIASDFEALSRILKEIT